MKINSKHGPIAVCLLVPALVICAVIYRFHFGADITDEAFYLATTRSIIEWGGPFVMNINVTQLSSLLMAPFVLLFRCFSPGDAGLVMATRYAYLATTLFTAACVFDFARRRVPLPLAIVLSAVPIAWMPFSLPACSYNTFATNFFTAALLITVAPPAVSIKRSLAGVMFFYLSIVGYPTLLAPAVIFYFALYLTSAKTDNSKKILATSFAAFVGLFAASAIALMAYEGAEPLLRCLVWTRASVDSNKSSKLLFWLSQFEHAGLLCRLSSAFLSGLFIYRLPTASLRLPASLILLVTCVYAAFVRSAPLYYQSHEVIILLVVSALFCFSKQEWTRDRKVAIAFWTSVIAGLITHASGTNGILNFPIGATTAAIISLTILCKTLRKWSPLPAVFVLCIICGMIFDFTTTIYGEWAANKGDLTFKIRSGPFKGIFTSQKRGQIISNLQADLNKLTDSSATIYIIGAPGYYLLSHQKGLDPFLYHINDRQSQIPVLRQFFSEEKHRADVIVHIVGDEYFGKAHAADKELLKRHYKVAKESPEYVIYIKRFANFDAPL